MNSSEFNYYSSINIKSAKIPKKGKRYSGSTTKVLAKGATVTYNGNRRYSFAVTDFMDYKLEKPYNNAQSIRKTSTEFLKEIENVSTTSCDEDHFKYRAKVVCEGVPVHQNFDVLEKRQNEESHRYFSQTEKFQGPNVKGLPMPSFF